MASPLDQLIREQGDEVAARVAAKLGIPREEAAKVLPEMAAAVLARFAPAAEGQPQGRPETLDGVLGGAGEEMGERLGARLGISPEQAAAVVPLVLPVILRFLVRRVPYGGMALSLLARTVEQQGYGSLDEIAMRLVGKALPPRDPADPPPPSLATRLGRLAGKYFPSGEG
jgi:hypothetical protein